MRYVIACLAAVLFLVASSVGQEAKEQPRHPGDIIKLEIKFDGPDASKIKDIGAELRLISDMPKNQANFNASFSSGAVSPASPNAFRPEIKIPDNAATGDYRLIVRADAEAGSAAYVAGDQFQFHHIHIDNPRTFTPPNITVKEQR